MTKDIQSKYWYLRSSQLFEQLTEKDYEELEWLTAFKSCQKNEFLYMPNEAHRKVYFVKRGMVKLGYYDDEGNEVILDILKVGDIFGEIGFDEQNINQEFAQALTNDTLLCNFNIAQLKELLETKPQLAFRFTKKMGEQQLSVTRRFSKIISKDSRSRLIEFFKDWIIEEKILDKENIYIKNYLTHQDLAGLNGLARQTVSTLLGQFKEEGILIFDRKEVFIPSVKNLK
jgi:CRP/FNR family cyclic AMP-dependent transcriptional regulator